MERYSKWIADQEIDGTTLCSEFGSGKDSFVTFAMKGNSEKPGLGSGTATVLYNALAEFLKGTGINPAESAGGGQGTPNGIVIVEVTTLALPQTVKAVTHPEDKGGAREARKNLFLKLLALETACSAMYHAYGNKKVVQFAMLDAKVFQTLDDGIPKIFMQFFAELFESELPSKIKEFIGESAKLKSEDIEVSVCGCRHDSGGDQKPGHMFEASVVAIFHDYLVGFLRTVKSSTAKLFACFRFVPGWTLKVLSYRRLYVLIFEP